MADQRVAVITGSGRGIGKGIAERLAKDGYAVVIADLDPGTSEATAQELVSKGFKAVSVAGDVSKKADHEKFVQKAVDEFGRLDTYINNAGIAQIKLLQDETPEDIEKIFSINVYGDLYGIQAAAEQFRKQDDGEHIRKIINASSIAGHIAFDLLGAYSATKFAVRGLTQAAAKELGRDHITVNAYCPGIVGTAMWDLIDDKMVELNGGEKGQYLKQYAQSITLGRVETPEDVANYVSYLASTGSDYMTGQAVQIDGGIQFI
ncbi:MULTISPECIES: acetoin reductase [Bifidobacterium]|jgi:meso-butanediol dehydrogenase/(S,S)-butanediol dehydrogenase/diacetyl reductase|uniref:diacetyl reductase [(S)-acetoin forming] n=1 Tax=Bifidobacterium tibiigranuli TaxID=2172043 RepID=A0A5N6S7D0_9BIFI|nr:acetoin reductase [Bifidobacterium tibiigranuli]KAE8130066.1 SDR family NAD(P)-dependent oxidoreductase [Bifidobacterium tibiigranuli]KAE8130576.1 diacetyl reductase [Bifidobacterium tibiigranuli]MCH3974562.1 acetoin reductase [Bifidobacterium tibiigranuli]MCH4189480.1 acetoin reductase [Bifidobacterium tibiigranuli]MCH4204303.1 acetoin reductase [Bifidobacterium tibiigranuli]